MTVASEVVTVTTSATALNAPEKSASDRVSVILWLPSGEADIHLGGPDVSTQSPVWTSADGPLAINDLSSGEQVYAVTASATSDVSVIRTGVG